MANKGYHSAYLFRRVIFITAMSVVFAVAFIFRGLVGNNAGPCLLRWYLQRCRAGFVKFGQVLAMRYDLLPPEYCEELSHLLDRLPPIPTPVIIRIIEAELKRPLDECFSDFDLNPV